MLFGALVGHGPHALFGRSFRNPGPSRSWLCVSNKQEMIMLMRLDCGAFISYSFLIDASILPRYYKYPADGHGPEQGCVCVEAPCAPGEPPSSNKVLSAASAQQRSLLIKS